MRRNRTDFCVYLKKISDLNSPVEGCPGWAPEAYPEAASPTREARVNFVAALAFESIEGLLN